MDDVAGAPLAKQIFEELEDKKIGKQIKFTVKQNKSVVSSRNSRTTATDSQFKIINPHNDIYAEWNLLSRSIY
jgi:hypothetical protein